MQYWTIVDENYLDYLREKEKRIPFSDYGANKFKPFFGVLFENDDLFFLTQISHAQPRHNQMKNSLDFQKIFLSDRTPLKPDRLVAVVNLNYMFPVPKAYFSPLDYKDISAHRTFHSERDKSSYIDLLKKELSIINTLDLETKAKKLYCLKKEFPDHPISRRCLDFDSLEKYAHEYNKRTN